MINDEKRGAFLANLRKKKKITQKELGDIIHYSDKNISKWERGISFPTNPNVLNKLCEYFGISLEELMYGELKNKDNSEKISKNLEHQFRKNYNHYRKSINIILICFLVFIIISLISIYMIFIRNSVSVYSLITYDDAVEQLNSTLLITNKVNILNFNQIKLKDEKDIELIKLFYIDDKNNKVVLFSGGNADYYIEDKLGYDEYQLNKLINNKIFLELNYENETNPDIIELKVKKRYTNDNIFPKRVVELSENESNDNDQELIKKLDLLNFKQKNLIYEKTIKKDILVTFDTDTMNMSILISNDNILEKISGNYYTKLITYEKYENGAIIEYEELNISDTKDCEKEKCSTKYDYVMYIEYLKNQLK